MGRLILAPLEGCMDWSVREMLTEFGGYAHCVTEFIRVNDLLLPERSYTKLAPELTWGGHTRSGTPVRVQLLGSNPEALAENAQRALAMGSFGVDYNLGCPSKTVNGSGGGAALLKTPDQIGRCVRALSDAVGQQATFSVKIRLGYDSPEEVYAIVASIVDAGAHELVIHARTKRDGYKAEAIKWDYIQRAAERAPIPVIANGEVWSKADWQACQRLSGCPDVMIGRGALCLPNIAATIKHDAPNLPWHEVLTLLMRYAAYQQGLEWFPGRCKQWIKYLRRQYPEQAQAAFNAIRSQRDTPVIINTLEQLRQQAR